MTRAKASMCSRNSELHQPQNHSIEQPEATKAATAYPLIDRNN